MAKPILCLDFDGVIHSYTSGWKGAHIIPDPPVLGALQFIVDAMEHFTVAIFSSRSHQPGGRAAMIEWLGKWSVDPVHGMPGNFDHGAWGAIQWATEKPSALVTLDDRAITFDGTWPRIEELRAFQPWNKKLLGARNTYSQGKLNDDDGGDIQMAVSSDKLDGIVRLDFGKPVAWLGFPPEQAIQLAKLIMKHAGAKTITVEF